MKKNDHNFLNRPQIMGIINITPDSCYDGGQYFHPQAAVDRAYALRDQGVDIVDVGAESSRPGAIAVTFEEEKRRLEGFLQLLDENYPIPLSIDTYKAKIADFVLQQRPCMMNDITGFSDPDMRAVAAKYQVDVCLMHMQSSPSSMQKNPTYPNGVINHLIEFFERRIHQLTLDGVEMEKIILDPGIGFGKTVAHNLEIYRNIDRLKKHFGLRILIGGSRKSFMGSILHKDYPDLLPATLVMHTLAITKGADILRVHDAPEHLDLAKIMHRYYAEDFN